MGKKRGFAKASPEVNNTEITEYFPLILSATERLKRFYDQFKSNDQVLIVIMADPDAIASAMAVKRLLWRKTAGVTISNINAIKRPDNIAMVARLNLTLNPLYKIDRTQFTRFVIVDSQPDHNEAFGGISPHVVIDHHPETGANADYMDIRPTYGATATMMTQYIRAARIKPSAKLATGLFYAIKTDTSNFERQTVIEDVRAFQFLFRHANIQLARKIEQSDIKLNFLKYFVYALENKKLRNNRIFVHLGKVATPDVCVIIADFFMRIDRINWSIVSGVYRKKLIVIFRNDGIRLNAGNMAKQSFGKLGFAGGHKSMARAEMALSGLNGILDLRDDKKVLRWVIASIEKRS